MDDSAPTRALLEEIRDVQREHLALYREQAARSIRLTEQAVQRQEAFASLYKRVLVVGALVIVAVVLLLLITLL